MKAGIRFALIGSFMVAALVSVSAAPKGKGAETAPGQADNFYRGVTTVGTTSTTETVVTSTVLSSEIETRLIGGGQANNKKDGNVTGPTVKGVSVSASGSTPGGADTNPGLPGGTGHERVYTR